MDLVRSFKDAGVSKGIEINIQGTPEDPLFQANQVGELLGIVKIRDTIQGFDDDEVRAGTTGANRTANFLTELGLYRLLGLSRKPFARPFQKWVAKVLKEIRLTGKFELEQQLQKSIADSEARAEVADQEHEAALALATKEKEDALTLATKEKEDALALAAKEKDDAIAAKDAELAALRSKTYEELPRLDTIYVNKEIAELSSNTHKIGRTIDTKKREAQLNTGSAQGSRMIYMRSTHNAKIVEDMCKVALKRYHIANLGGVEHYSCSTDHSVDVIDFACTVMDTMASSFEYITRRDLYKKVMSQLKASMGGDDSESDSDDDEDDDNSSSFPNEEDPRVIKSRDFVEANVNFRPVRPAEAHGKKYFAWIPEAELMSRFWEWYMGPTDDNPAFRCELDKALGGKKSWKKVLQSVMASKGRAVAQIKPVIEGGGRLTLNAFDNVAWFRTSPEG